MDVSTIRSRLAASVEALSGWHESTWAPPQHLDTDHLLHHVFTIEPITTTVEPSETRQRASRGVYAETIVLVTWVHRITLDNQITSYAAALDAEADVVAAVLATDDTPSDGGVHYLLDSMSRDTSDSWVVGKIRLRVVHQLGIS